MPDWVTSAGLGHFCRTRSLTRAWSWIHLRPHPLPHRGHPSTYLARLDAPPSAVGAVHGYQKVRLCVLNVPPCKTGRGEGGLAGDGFGRKCELLEYLGNGVDADARSGWNAHVAVLKHEGRGQVFGKVATRR